MQFTITDVNMKTLSSMYDNVGYIQLKSKLWKNVMYLPIKVIHHATLPFIHYLL